MDKKPYDNLVETIEGESQTMENAGVPAVLHQGLAIIQPNALEQIELRIAVHERLRDLTLKRLDESDFQMFGTNAWLKSSGVGKISEIYGLAWDEPITKLIWDKDSTGIPYFYYRATVRVWYPRDRRFATSIGSASSRDNLYKDLHPDDVDKTDVEKHAITNAMANAISDLGFKYSMDEIKKAGKDTSKMDTVEFKKGARSGKDAASTADEPSQAQWGKLAYEIGTKIPPDGYPKGETKDSLIRWFHDAGYSKKALTAIIGYFTEHSDVEYSELFVWLENNKLLPSKEPKPAPTAPGKKEEGRLL